ncbi:hypothetical protein DFJ74DRAFT_668854 [Hyaloraphidium curvatum]|nr:hypothetical protein DFJ74DRAFT_668854 [Hyaloraphidium curvatum]
MGRDPDDRDSAFFLDTFRDLEYRCLVGAARDNLAAGVGAVVVAPLSKEVKGGLLHDREWLGLKPGDAVSVSVIWMRVDEAEARRRMAERADPRDAYKLANWELYAPRRPELVAAHPRTLVLDTTGGHGAVDVDAVVDFVLGSSAGARM